MKSVIDAIADQESTKSEAASMKEWSQLRLSEIIDEWSSESGTDREGIAHLLATLIEQQDVSLLRLSWPEGPDSFELTEYLTGHRNKEEEAPPWMVDAPRELTTNCFPGAQTIVRDIRSHWDESDPKSHRHLKRYIMDRERFRQMLSIGKIEPPRFWQGLVLKRPQSKPKKRNRSRSPLTLLIEKVCKSIAKERDGWEHVTPEEVLLEIQDYDAVHGERIVQEVGSDKKIYWVHPITKKDQHPTGWPRFRNIISKIRTANS
ncbi:MAG: hypothetical protein HQL53_06035 [Magnetococcales bacterium]|nr:hypothetical protein [Magnetococcales bacterium]